MRNFSRVTLLVSALLVSSASFAAGPEMIAFFTSFQGHWEGQGMHRELQNDGSTVETPYTLELNVDASFDNSWTAHTHSVTPTGLNYYNDASYSVNGDLLYVGSYSATDPAGVSDSTETGLTFRFQRADIYTGRVFTFTTHVEFTTAGGLSGWETAESNGLVLTEDRYSAKRW